MVGNWLHLLRAPNLLTVPGDTLAGCAITAAWDGGIAPPLRWLMLSIACPLLLYSHGLILNDLVDCRADRRNRNGRPLADGQISLAAAFLAALGLGAGGIALAWLGGGKSFWTAAILVVAILLYNFLLKKFAVAGSVAMGLCRGLSLLLGAAIMGSFALPAVLAAIGLTAYIGTVTWIADHEEDFFDFDRKAFLPLAGYAGTLLCAWGLGWINAPQGRMPLSLVPGTLGLLRVLYICSVLSRGAIAPDTTQRSIGAFIRALLPLQAALLILCPGTVALALGVILLLVLWPAARILSHRFQAS